MFLNYITSGNSNESNFSLYCKEYTLANHFKCLLRLVTSFCVLLFQLEIYAKSCKTQLSMQVQSAECVCLCLSGCKCEKNKIVFTGKAHSSQNTSNPTA